MEKLYLNVAEASARYGPKPSAFRKWIRTGQLGSAVVRCGKSVFLDSRLLKQRLQQTGQLLVEGGDEQPNARENGDPAS
jgi:hypothetical protein